ncbi:MAG: DHHW family protein [Eubacteriales bacterium]
MNSRPEKNTEQDILLDIQMRCAPRSRVVDLLTVFTFAAAIFVVAVLFLVLPDKSFSEQENRALQQNPKLSTPDKFLGRLLDGSYTADIAKYYADQFPARDLFIGIKGFAEIALQKQENNSVILARDNFLVTRPPVADYKSLEENMRPIGEFAAVMKKMDVPVTLAVAGRTYDVMNSYLPGAFPKTLQDQLWVYAQYVADENKDLQYINLSDYMKKLVEDGTASGPLYYRTDHHWTTRGAYYAYSEIIKSFKDKELQPEPLSAFTVEQASTGFNGTTWSKAGMKWIKPDTIEYFRYEGDEDYVTTIEDTGVSFNGFYDRSYLEKKDKYSSFISGNNGRVDIKRADGQKREKLLVMKDSFAHSVIPFLAKHYDLVILDLRYYSESVPKLVLIEGISRVLVLGNMENFSQNPIYGNLSYGADQALATYIKNSFPIQDIQVNGNSIEDYVIVHPDIREYTAAAKTLHDIILEKTGFDLKTEVSSEYDKYDKAIILADTGLTSNGLIKISVEGNSLYLRSTAVTGITGVMETFLETYIKKGTGAFNFPEGYIYTDLTNNIVIIMPE